MYVSSSGGHFTQLEAYLSLSRIKVKKILVAPCNSKIIKGSTFCKIHDTNRDDFIGILKYFFFFIYIIIKHKPDLIISMGAAPGALALIVGKCLFVKGIWVESIANAATPSLSGKLVKKIAKYWVTQSSDVNVNYGGLYYGKIFNIYKRRNSATLRQTH